MSEGTGLKLDELRAQRAQLRANMKQVEQEMNSSNENGSGSHSQNYFLRSEIDRAVCYISATVPILSCSGVNNFKDSQQFTS